MAATDPSNLSKVSFANAEHSAVHADADNRISALERTLTTGLPPANAAALNQIEVDWKAMQAAWAAAKAQIASQVGPAGATGATGAQGPAGRSVVVTSGAAKPTTPSMGDVHVGLPDTGGHVDVNVYDGLKWVSIDGRDGRDGRDGVDGAKGDKGDKGDRGIQGLPFNYQGEMFPGTPSISPSASIVGHAWWEKGTRSMWICSLDARGAAQWTHWVDCLPAGIAGATGAQGATGPQGPAGPNGESAWKIWQDSNPNNAGQPISVFLSSLVGPKGDPGQTLKVQGAVADKTLLPAAPAPLTVLFTTADKHIWIFDPSSAAASLGTSSGGATKGWVDCGVVEGPAGPPGPRGQGVVQTEADLPARAAKDTSYFVLDTAQVMQWDTVSGWHSIGQPGIGALRDLLMKELSRFATGISHGVGVETFGENTPPVGAGQDEYFIVGPKPTGAWANHANHLTWKSGRLLPDGTQEWLFAVPDPGDSHMIAKDVPGAGTSWANCILTWTLNKLDNTYGWVKTGSMSAAALGAGSTVGMISYFAKGTLPKGWLECNGQPFDVNVYPALSQHLGTNTVPDLRDQFIRVRSTQTLLQRVTGTTKKPTRGLDQVFATEAGIHSHKVTVADGNAVDTWYDQNPTGMPPADSNWVGGSNKVTLNTDTQHVIQNSPSHWHNIEFRGDWDAETAPNHVYLVAAICALDAGREGVQGPPGLQGTPGADGKTGPAGPAGETFKISGTVATPSALPASPTHLTVYMVVSDGHLYIYDAASNAAVTAATAAGVGYTGAPVGYVDLGKVSGPKGDTGDAGSVTISTVKALPTGATPMVVNTGTKKDAVLEISIPTGPAGVAGPTGPAGVAGPAGKIVSVTARSVATGSPAAASNTGTEDAAALVFDIPAGAKGDKGDKGDKGNDGSTLTVIVAKGGTPSATPPTGTTYSQGQLAVVLK